MRELRGNVLFISLPNPCVGKVEAHCETEGYILVVQALKAPF